MFHLDKKKLSPSFITLTTIVAVIRMITFMLGRAMIGTAFES